MMIHNNNNNAPTTITETLQQAAAAAATATGTALLATSACTSTIQAATTSSNSRSSRTTMSEGNKDSFILFVSASLFTITATWIVRNLRSRSYYRYGNYSNTVSTTDSSSSSSSSSSSQHQHQTTTTTHGNGDTNTNNTLARLAAESHVSVRGYRVAHTMLYNLPHFMNNSSGMTLYLHKFFTAINNMCDVIDNRQGYIPICVAENKLITDILAERMNQAGTSELAFSELQTYYYHSFTGLPMLKDAVSYFLCKRFLYPERTMLPIEEALGCIPSNCIAIGSGAASVLHNLFYLLGQENDCCFIPTPYYAAFENDMNVVSKVVPFPIVPTSNPMNGPTIQELDIAYFQAKTVYGYTPKFVLLTNPNNPLGTIYTPETIQMIVQWCQSKKETIHLIVDEIYALSTHKPNGQHSFQSIIKIMNNQLGNTIHMIWALSKDFGSSGIRCGVLYSQNETLHKGLNNIQVFGSVSGPVQYMISEVLTDDHFIDMFLERSRQRILYNCTICVTKLNEMIIPYIQPEACIFLYIDLSSLLPQKTFAYERQLTELLFDCRLVLTPGESQRDQTPGMYRICYTWVSPDVLEIGMERLSRLVAKIRRMDWDDLLTNEAIHTRTIASILDI